MKSISKYRTKVIEVKAILYDGSAESIMDIIDFYGSAELKGDSLFLKSLNGSVEINEGDYLVKNPDDSFNRYPSNKFKELFESVN